MAVPSRHGCSSSAALSRGLTHATMGLSQVGGWRKPGGSKHCTGKKFNSRDTTAHWHCRMHSEVSIAHAVHLRAWEERHAVEGTDKRLMNSHRELTPGENKS